MDRKILLINAAVSIALIAIILNAVGISDVVLELGRVDIPYLILAMLSLLGMDLLMSYRIRILLDEAAIRLPFLDIIRSHFVGMLISDFTPSRSGYFATAAVLRYNYRVPSEKALLSIFGPQIFDFAFKLISGSIAIFYIMFVFIGPDSGWILFLGAFAIGFFILIMLLVLFSGRFLQLFSFSRSIPLLSRLYDVVVKMQDNSHIIVRKTPHILIILLFNWVFRSLSWYFVAKSIGLTLQTPFPEPFFYFFLQPLVSMLEFVPSPTIAGLGLSEGGTRALA